MYISVMFAGLFGMFMFAGSADPVTYLDRRCGDDLSNLWLDVVLVVDNSRAVTRMDRVRKNILNTFHNGTNIGTSEDNPRTTRVSLVTYNKYSEIIADLNQFESFDDFNKSISMNLANSSTFDESYLIKGLESATVVLEKSSLAGERLNYKKVIVIYASLGDDILLAIPLADRLKADGITIIAVAETSGTDNEKLDFWLDLISSGSMSFSIQDEKLVQEIQDSFLQTNCFCPNGWVQLRTSYYDMHSYRYGICLSLSPLTAIWRAARLSCRNQWRNGYLVNEYEANKHNYVLESLRNSSLFRLPYTYHIGLTYLTGSWYWDQPEGNSLRKVDNQQWKNWNPGYPILSSTQTIGVNVQNVIDESETGWQNENAMGEAHYYVCEVASCDTDNYCETEDN